MFIRTVYVYIYTVLFRLSGHAEVIDRDGAATLQYIYCGVPMRASGEEQKVIASRVIKALAFMCVYSPIAYIESVIYI